MGTVSGTVRRIETRTAYACIKRLQTHSALLYIALNNHKDKMGAAGSSPTGQVQEGAVIASQGVRVFVDGRSSEGDETEQRFLTMLDHHEDTSSGERDAAILRPVTPVPFVTDKINPSLFAATISNVLSPDECTRFIAAAEAVGFSMATVNVGGGREVAMTDYRNSDRLIVDLPRVADVLLARIRHALPHRYRGYEIVGINERLRFLKYGKPGAQFEMHRDGTYTRPAGAGGRAGECSVLTVLLYLNEGYEGCPTTFYALKPLTEHAVTPHTGMVLVHDHSILHAATPLISGVKYVIRTEIMCRRVA
eukprot:GDKI01018770.1.p1 GENE.GDKI01018770.1~~GDKI01018770.1.p1  ORF type:complete len:307 (-),score=82.89 GDKI01018770.1:205-1125(-)